MGVSIDIESLYQSLYVGLSVGFRQSASIMVKINTLLKSSVSLRLFLFCSGSNTGQEKWNNVEDKYTNTR